MRHIGIDYGTKRVGIAVSDESGSIALPRETISNTRDLAKHIAALVEGVGAVRVVIGMPETPGEMENAVTGEIRAFAAALADAVSCPVSFAPEQFTSLEAARFANGKRKDDASAAALILQRFLDMHANTQ